MMTAARNGIIYYRERNRKAREGNVRGTENKKNVIIIAIPNGNAYGTKRIIIYNVTTATSILV